MLIGIAIFAGVFLIWRGYWGRRLGTRPICVHCGYDLTGRPADSLKCAECGADLQKHGSIAVGIRRRYRTALGAGILIVAMALGATGFDITRGFTWKTWMPWLPFRMVMSIANSSNASSHPALVELLRRCDAHCLTHAQTSRLGESALRSYKRAIQRYDPLWSDIIEDLGMSGDLTPTQWDGYCRSMVSASLRTRKLIRRGDPIVVAADVGFNWSSARFDSGIQSSLDWQVISMNIDGTQIAFPKMLGRQSIIPNWAIQGGGSGERRIDLPSPLLAKLGNGPHRIGLRIHVRVSHGPSSHNSRPMACVFDQSLSDQMTLVPANAPTLAMVSPTELHAQMYGAFVPHIYAWPSGGLEISMACNNVPVTFMGHVLVRFNGQEQKLDDLQCPKGSYTSGLGWLVETPSGRPDNVDLILRPDSTMPISMIDLTAIWGKDIVFPNLPVEELPHG